MPSTPDNGTWLDSNNKEFQLVKYYLELCVGSSYSVTECSVYKFDNIKDELRFDRQYQGRERLVAWKNLTQIPTSMIQRLAEDGFTFDDKGMDFTIGSLDIKSDDNIKSKEKDNSDNGTSRINKLLPTQEYRFVYSDVVLGRAKVTDGAGLSEAKKNPIPSGYDSYYITPSLLDENQDGEFSLSEYRKAADFQNRTSDKYSHRYLIKNPEQVLPRYSVKFVLGSAAHKRKYTNEDITRAASTFVHPETLKLVNKEDTLNMTAGLLPVGQAFDQVVIEFKDTKEKTTHKEKELQTLESDLADKVRAINLAYAKGYHEIQEAQKKAVRELQTLTRTKLEEVLCVDIELHRQREYMQWLHLDMKSRIQQVGGDNVSLTSVSKALKESSAKTEGYGGTVANPDIVEFMRMYSSYLHHMHQLNRTKPVELAGSLDLVSPIINVNPSIQVSGGVIEENDHVTLASARDSVTQVLADHHAGVYSQRPSKIIASQSTIDGGDDGMSNSVTHTHRDSTDKTKSRHENSYDADPKYKYGSESFYAFLSRASMEGVYEREAKLLYADPGMLALQPEIDDSMRKIQEEFEEIISKKGQNSLPTSLSNAIRPLTAGQRYSYNAFGVSELSSKGLLHPSNTLSNTGNSKNSRKSELFQDIDGHSHASRASRLRSISSQMKRRSYFEAHSQKDNSTIIGKRNSNNGDTTHKKPSVTSDRTSQPTRKKSSLSAVMGLKSDTGAGVATGTRESQGKHAMKALFGSSNNNKEDEARKLASLQQQQQQQQQQENYSNNRNMMMGGMPISNDSGVDLTHQQIDDARNISKATAKSAQNDETLEESLLKSTVQPQAPISADNFTEVSQRHSKQHSLLMLSQRRAARLGHVVETLTDMLFVGSDIISTDEAQRLYLSLPFTSTPPKPEMLYSSLTMQPTLDTLYSACTTVRQPVVLLIKSGEYTFGCYLSMPINLNGIWSGTPNSFMFSLTLDLKFPYHGQLAPGIDRHDPSHTYAFYCDLDHLLVGNGDLVINADLASGSSELEGCYGVGMAQGSIESKRCLAGAHVFSIDALEVWTIS